MKTTIIGVGRMGRWHVKVVREMGLDLAGVCDGNPEALAVTGRDHGVSAEKQFTDAADMLAKIQPECVIVATTGPSHCRLTCQAAEAGAKFILCEKPMAVSLAECDLMIETCQKHGALLAVNHQMRFMEQYTEPKRIAQSAAFGGLSSVTVVAGNFGMSMNGTHYLEMFRYMTGEAPVEVSAWFSPDKVSNPRGPQYEDRAGSLRAVTASGKRYYMEIGSDQGHGMLVTYAGPYGRIVVDELAGRMFVAIRKEEHRNLPTTRYGMPWDEEDCKIAPADIVGPTRAVLEALLKGQNYPSGEESRLAVAALVAAYESDEKGHIPVRIDDRLPRKRVFPWA